MRYRLPELLPTLQRICEMARMPRIVVPGQALHIIQRGHNRQSVFFSDDDRHTYLETLQQAADENRCAVHAYVLMTNHVHLLLTPEHAEGPSRTMQAVGRTYVRHVNRRYRRTGTLWEGRFKSALIDSEQYLLSCSRYIELNPVRAGMVQHPAEYRWSSYRRNALGENDSLITPHLIYDHLDSTANDRQAAYAKLFLNRMDQAALDTLRTGTQSGSVIGNERFRNQIESVTGQAAQRYPHGGDRRSRAFRKPSDKRRA
jgi:putative transposase